MISSESIVSRCEHPLTPTCIRSIDSTAKQQQQNDSSLVSPENSEDGRLPTVADTVAAAQQANIPALPPVAPAPLPLAAFQFPQGMSFPMQSAMPAIATGLPTQALFPPTTATQNHIVANPNKRQRLDVSMLTKQQLAEAAAQAFQKNGPARKKSQAQIDRRRERNRILARRTRLRKKFFFESLQKEVMDLQQENQKLKDIVSHEIKPDELRNSILESCTAMEQLPESVMEACGEKSDEMMSQDFSLVQSIQRSQHCFVITDPCLPDNPIVFASDDFLKLIGYTRDQVLGRNCRFLQGNETSKESVEEIRKGLMAGGDVTVTLVNYTVDGTPFWNKLFIAALRDAQNSIVNYIGVSVKYVMANSIDCFIPHTLFTLLRRVSTPEPGHPEHGKTFEPPGKAETTLEAIEDSVSAIVSGHHS